MAGRSPRWRRNRRLKCMCEGYHFPHRRAGGACNHSRTQVYHLLIRAGETPLDAFIEAALVSPGAGNKDATCPF